MEVRKQWEDLFKVLKEKEYQARIPYPAKPLFEIREEIKTFLDKNERTHHQQICNTEIQIPLAIQGKRKMKSTRNGNYVGKFEILFFLFFKSL